MPRPLCDSPYIFGIHEEGGEQHMLAKGKPGWIVFTEELGTDPNNRSGRDYRSWSDRGLGVIVRLNHGYEPNGTIPHSSRYADFARRCANFVAASRGAHIWIIGNEPNLAGERPGVQRDWSAIPPRIVKSGEVITPSLYVSCYLLCREAIKGVQGHENDQVCVAAVAPWNNETSYPGNETGDWVVYLRDVLRLLGPSGCDGITLHAYTHGADPNLIYSEARMGPPFQNRYYHFYVYRDFMNVIPASMRHLPVYITETDQSEPWADVNSGWVRNAYGEINWWNQQPGHQQIRLLALYRWPARDQWVIEGKRRVIEDFLLALDNDYRWREVPVREPYRAAFVSHNTPTQMRGESTYTVGLRLKNEGSRIWQQTGANPVHVGFHWFDQNGQSVLLRPEDDLRSELPTDVEPDAEVVVEASVVAPSQPGSYVLEWDLVEEGVTWFRDRGSRPLSVPVEVAAPLPRFAGRVPRPEIEDVVGRLDRDGARFVKRPLERVRYLVFNHTAVPATVSAERLAAAHRQRGLPGFAGQYLITGEGRILQTEPLDEVVDGVQPWSVEGINIYMAGNFMDAAPVAAQIEAAAHLSAWLLQELNLPETAVVGLSELIQTQSPGAQWLTGARWKDTLLQRMRELRPTPAPGDELAELRTRLAEAEAARDRFQARVAELEAELSRLRQQQRVPRPVIEDVVGRLDRDGARFVKRPLERVRYLVFNHTAVPATVSVERLAAAHRQRGLPGFAGQYLITGEGRILQTEPLDEVVDGVQPWSVEGINIYMAGNFETGTPPEAQIAAAAWLSAWLLQELKLPETAVVGLSELIQTQSPGAQWLTGARWKDTLLQKAREIKADPTQWAAGFWQELVRLHSELEAVQQQLNAASAQVEQLRGQVEALRRQLQDMPVGPIPKPALRVIVDELPKSSDPTNVYDTRARSAIKSIVVHHTAVSPTIGARRVAEVHVNTNGWPGIGYHFFVNPDGTIEQTNWLETISAHTRGQNHYSVGVVFAGDFTSGTPTSAQIEQGGHLIAWLMQQLGVPLDQVRGHREMPNQTTECPGNQWLEGERWREALVRRIQAVQAGQLDLSRKTINHYLLFWWRSPDLWAQQDWINAQNYIRRFRPTCGFRLEDAIRAEYVTIIGGVAGVSGQDEERLRAAGCKVERLAGADEAETKAILDGLAASGRRFKTFDA